jgi:thiol-disulfide isomerase/thioredoxin
VVVVNFWATWCAPCRKEVPLLKSLHREFRDRSVEILGLSVEDSQEAANLVRMFADQYEIKYRLGFASEEMFNKFSGPDPSPVVPQTFVFDKSGTLTLHLSGLHPEFAEILRETIEKSL